MWEIGGRLPLWRFWMKREKEKKNAMKEKVSKHSEGLYREGHDT